MAPRLRQERDPVFLTGLPHGQLGRHSGAPLADSG
jgi:hypothetical protein